MTVSNEAIVLAYRHLYQHLLRAVQYSKPARYIARDHLRNAFRTSSVDAYDAARISATLDFLKHATETKDIEHKVLKNLIHVSWARKKLRTMSTRQADKMMRAKAYDRFDQMVERLNETMGLCIK